MIHRFFRSFDAMLDKGQDHNDEYDRIEGNYKKDRTQKTSKKHCYIIDEATERERVKCKSSTSTKGWTYYPSVELCLILTTKFLSIESGISTGTNGTTEWYKEHIDVNMNVMSHANIPQQMMETAMI